MQVINESNKPNIIFKNSVENHFIFLRGFSINSKLINEKVMNIIEIIRIVLLETPNDQLNKLITPQCQRYIE